MNIDVQIGEIVILAKTGKVGKVTEVDDEGKLKVDFGNGEEKKYKIIEAFKDRNLIFENKEKQSELEDELKREEEEAKLKRKLEALLAEQNRIEEEERQRIKDEIKTENPSILGHPSLLEIRSNKGRAVFLVCQNNTFDIESWDWYLWAPNNNNRASHQEMKYVKQGDIIVHHFANTIWAVSVAQKDCYEGYGLSMQDERGIGYVVEAEYSILSNPTSTESLREEKKNYGNYQYGPFDKNGNNNQGVYLTELSLELAKIFLDLAIKNNPGDKKIQTIKSLL